MTNVRDIYTNLAVRINYPINPTYRCLNKIIGHLNLLLSLSTTPQVIVEVQLSGESGKRYYDSSNNEKIAYLKSGKPCLYNPDGTINTKEQTGYVIRTELFVDLETNQPKKFIDKETDVLADDKYLQPVLTSLFLVLQGVSPAEAVMYINDACTKSEGKVQTRQIDMSKVKRRI